MDQVETNDVPVARLIGFEAKEIADGRAVVSLAAGQQHANPKLGRSRRRTPSAKPGVPGSWCRAWLR